MTEETNSTNNNEQCLTYSEQDKELALKAKQEFESGQFEGKFNVKLCH